MVIFHNKRVSIQIDQKRIKKQLSKLPKWKACGPDKVHGYWLKIFDSIHERMSEHLQDCVDTGEVPNWVVTGRTALIYHQRYVKGESCLKLSAHYLPCHDVEVNDWNIC